MELKFYQTIRSERENKGITIMEAKAVMGVDRRRYMEYENGESFVTIFSLRKLALLLNVDVNYLLTGTHDFDGFPTEALPLTDKDSFGLWFYKWVFSKEDDVTFSQITLYHCTSQKILPEFGNKKISEIHLEEINVLLKSLSSFSKRTVRMVKSILKQVFSFAIDCRAINYNPAVNAKIPKMAADAVETSPVSDETKKMIMQFRHPMQPAAVIMLLAGLRRGEVLALTFEDLHLFEGYISVNKVIEMHNGCPYLVKRAKTESGIRDVDISQTLISFFINYLKTYPNKKPTDLILSDLNGKPLGAKQFYRLWKDYLIEMNAKYGDFSDLTSLDKKEIKNITKLPMRIEVFTTKQLRHTYATMLYLSNVDILTAKSQMGHKKVSTTLGIYCHLDKIYKRNQIGQFESYFNTITSGDSEESQSSFPFPIPVKKDNNLRYAL